METNAITLLFSLSLILPSIGCGDNENMAPAISGETTGSCSDGLKNGSEVDIDCGGGMCARCDVGLACIIENDCESLVCDNGECVDAPLPSFAYLKASNSEQGEYFGSSIAISGNTMVVGAPGEASCLATNQEDNACGDAGAAYVLVLNNGTWSPQAYLKAAVPRAQSNFGSRVAISGDTIVVGAKGENGDAGGVYVFTRSGNSWIQQSYLTASNSESGDLFGSSVAISADTIVVGAEGEDSCADGVNGDLVDNECEEAGAVYLFTRNEDTWTPQAYIKASNSEERTGFGADVDISGNTIIVGSPSERSCDSGVNSSQSNRECIWTGAAYVYTRIDGSWSQQAYLKPSNSDSADFFGGHVAISNDIIVVGASREGSCSDGVNGDQRDNTCDEAGAAYVFARIVNDWSQQAYLKASNSSRPDNFGSDVAISGSTIVVGAVFESSCSSGVNGIQTNDACADSGAAYVFKQSGDTWGQQSYLKASNSGVMNNWGPEKLYFGGAVAISDETIMIGAAGESSCADDVDGDQTDTSCSDAGAAYIFSNIQ